MSFSHFTHRRFRISRFTQTRFRICPAIFQVADSRYLLSWDSNSNFRTIRQMAVLCLILDMNIEQPGSWLDQNGDNAYNDNENLADDWQQPETVCCLI